MATCAKCNQPLEVTISLDGFDDDDDVNMDGEGEEPQTFPDDVKLSCGCHFHWQCLLDAYELDKCPNCSKDIISSPASASGSSSAHAEAQQQIIVDINNEGGPQEHIDIFPILKEESYLRAYPEERKCRAFLEFCKEGDYRAIVDLLKSCSGELDENGDDIDFDELGVGEGVESKSAEEILRYQDPINEMQSGLHAAAANGHRDVAWLLLLLASSYPEKDIPALVFQEAASLGVMRDDQDGLVDIRSLKDAQGRTAEDIAAEAGIIWNGWLGNGRLAMP